MAETTIAVPVAAEPLVEPKTTRKFRRPAWLVPAGSVAAGLVPIAVHAALYSNWLIDDAGITFAYARQVAEGNGPVFQPGAAPLEGFSDPAWLALLAIGKLVGLFDRGTLFGIPDYVLFPKALALLCCAGILAACYAAARKVTTRPWLVTVITGVLLGSIPSFVIWSFSGLENSLYGLAVTLLAVVMFRAVLDDRPLAVKVAAGTGLLVALAALTRPDGLIYVAAYPIVLLIRFRPRQWRRTALALLLSVAAFGVVFGGYLAWRLAEFGRWVSITAISKRQQPPKLEDLVRLENLVHYVGVLAVLAGAGLIGMVLIRPSRLRDAMVALLVPLLLAMAAYAVLEPDWMGELRFATPVWCLGAFAVALAGHEVLSTASPRVRIVLVVALVAALIPTGQAFASAAKAFRTAPTVPLCNVAERYGRAFNGYADVLGIQHGTLVAPDMGGSGLTSRLTLVDMAGLTDETTAEAWGAWDMAAIRDYVFDTVKPTFIHTHTVWSTNTELVADPRMARDYVAIITYPDHPDPAGDWVRRDAVTSPDKLAAAQNYARTVMRPAENMTGDSRLGNCGPTLRPGQTPWRPAGSSSSNG